MVLDSNLFVHNVLRGFIALNLFLVASVLTGQEGNPFEVKPRYLIKTDGGYTHVDSTKKIELSNPFQIVSSGAIDSTHNIQHKNFFEIQVDRALISNSDQNELNSSMLWMMIFLFSILALAVNINRGLVTKLYRTSFNLNLFNTLYRENKEENRLMFPLLYGLYFVAISIFIFQGFVHFKENNNIFLLIYITLGVLTLYLGRHLSLKIFANLFGLQKEIDHYLFNIICFGSVVAILFIPLDFIIIYSKPEWSKRLLILGSLIFIGFYLLRQLKEIMTSSNLWTRSIIHFLLYLCAFEITPLVLLYAYIHQQGWV